MIAFWLVLLTAVLGWIISGSVVPTVAMVFSVTLHWFLVLTRFPLNRLLIGALVLLIMTMQAFAFTNGYAGIIYEELPGAHHVGMGCFLWGWLISMLKDDSRKRVGGWYFCISLVGAIMMFWTAASVEIFRFEPLLIRSLAAFPLVMVLWQEYFRHSRAGLIKTVFGVCLLTALGGFFCSSSRSSSSWLSQWLKSEETFEYELDHKHSSTSDSVGLAGGEGIVDLPRKANIVVDKKTRFYLKVASIEDFLSLTRRPLYLRTSTVAIFQGNDRILPVRKDQWLLDGDDGRQDQIVPLPERTPKGSLEYAIVLPKEDAKLVPLVEGTNRVRADELFYFAEGRYQLEKESQSDWLRFSAFGPRNERAVDLVPRVETALAGPHLSLPNTELARRIRSLTKEVTAGKRPESAVSDYIKNQCRYSLKYRNPGNLSPVENLLFGEKKGHCELFATATVMMLRSAGIPSRVAYGYTGGASNREQLAIAFRGSDIHAWAEILTEAGEWRIFDTTPADRGAERVARSGAGGIDWKMAAFNPEEGIILSDQESGAGNFLAGIFATFSDWAASYFFVLIGVVVAAIVLIRLATGKWFGKKSSARSGQSNKAGTQQGVPPDARPEYIEAILALGEKAGISRNPGHTLREYIALLNSRGIGYVGLHDAVEYFYQTRYGSETVDRETERGFLSMIREYESERKGEEA